ncbi:MAG: riboflavin biosynthesis protein RibF [Prevotella sp.]|nr:riboflavin biosynthesis protein RibF [Prevotella sp.]
METIFLDDKKYADRQWAATIGMFDGIHLGHQFVLRRLTETARRRGLGAAVVTFQMPEDTATKTCQFLASPDEKLALLEQAGVERCVVLPFNEQLKRMTAHDFMLRVLREQLGVCLLLTGYDNRFGHNRTDGFDDYVRYGREMGIEVEALPPASQKPVSSSLIRQLLAAGDVCAASEALGRCYALWGRVVCGKHVGTRLGFPTANIQPDEPRQLVPGAGVYAVTAEVEGEGTLLPAMMNIGTRPTFGLHGVTLEAHLLRFSGNLYGRRICIRFVQRLRDEQRFDSPEALRRQLERDAAEATRILDLLNEKNEDK